jgi:hypothetical protein
MVFGGVIVVVLASMGGLRLELKTAGGAMAIYAVPPATIPHSLRRSFVSRILVRKDHEFLSPESFFYLEVYASFPVTLPTSPTPFSIAEGGPLLAACLPRHFVEQPQFTSDFFPHFASGA